MNEAAKINREKPMSKELETLSARVVAGTMSRREFMSRAAALGVSAAVASTFLAQPAKAAPVAGGTFKMGVQGGESTNSQDPATWASDVPLAGGFLWGEPLVELNADGSLKGLIAESWEASADATVWRFKIRSGINFSNGAAVTADDVMKTMSFDVCY